MNIDQREERRTKPYKEHLRERLKTPDEYRGYLDACHEQGPETFALAVQDVLDFVATAMRDKCVEKVRALQAELEERARKADSYEVNERFCCFINRLRSFCLFLSFRAFREQY